MLTRRRLAPAIACALALLAPAPLAEARPTYVSLTFDDASADQMAALPILADHGMRGTFYVVSGEVGASSYYMTWSQVAEVAAAGHEIGGHTVDHPDLTTLSPEAQVAEVCDDRQALIARGHDPVSFAYPFAKWNASARAAVQSCGYGSGRGVGGAGCLPGCVPGESVPPADPYVLRTPPGHTSTTKLSTVQGYVNNAVANGGGWVILTLHNICNKCDANSIRSQDLDALLDWLATKSANGVSVKTVREVMALPPPPEPPNLLQNPGLEAGLSATGASCWLRAGYAGPSGGGHTAVWAHTSDAHGGANAETVSITSRLDGDEKLVSGQTTSCSPPGTPAHVYQIGAWYKTSAGANVRMVAYYRDAGGAWPFWREQVISASTAWTRVVWQTPPLPSGATAVGIGFSLRSVGTATVDDLTLGDLGGA